MTCPSLADAKLIERFLRTQHFRHVATPKNYAGTLRNFTGFVSKHSGAAAPTVPILQQWLKERSLKWPAHILYHRTFLVERYLQWLQKQGVIASNPFAELHRQYGPRTTPIVRALVSKDSNTLEQLRQLPPFGSFLGRVMEDHVAHMRTLGYRYDTNEELLLRFDRFLQRHPELSGTSAEQARRALERRAAVSVSPLRGSQSRSHRLEGHAPARSRRSLSCPLAMVLLEQRANTTALPTSTRTRRYGEYCGRRSRTRRRKPRGVRSASSRCSCLPTAPVCGAERSRA